MALPPERIRVRVVYACADRQSQVEVCVGAGTSVAHAVAESGLADRFADLGSAPLQCAVFGRVVALGSEVHDGDRVEILRPLIADPKESRRQAAARSRQSGGARPRKS